MLLTVCFWNINGRDLAHLFSPLLLQQNVDIFILAECRIALGTLLPALNQTSAAPFRVAPGFNSKLQIFTRLPQAGVSMVADIGGVALRSVRLPVGPSILLAALHLPSKLHYSAEDQAQHAFTVVQDIERAEVAEGHSRTLVIGDLNMNPFEPGVVGSSAFHAVSARNVASRNARKVAGRSRPYFYNPSWHLLSDLGAVPGTYYYSHAGPVNYHWNVFDQALLRPQLLPFFVPPGLQVVTNVGATPLLNSLNRPGKAIGSDHLPITICLDIT